MSSDYCHTPLLISSDPCTFDMHMMKFDKKKKFSETVEFTMSSLIIQSACLAKFSHLYVLYFHHSPAENCLKASSEVFYWKFGPFFTLPISEICFLLEDLQFELIHLSLWPCGSLLLVQYFLSPTSLEEICLEFRYSSQCDYIIEWLAEKKVLSLTAIDEDHACYVVTGQLQHICPRIFLTSYHQMMSSSPLVAPKL